MVRFYLDWRAAASPLLFPPFQRDHLSDDAVDDMAQYIIQQGKAFYDDILAHPEKHKAIDENAGSAYGSVISSMFSDRFHEEIGLIVARMEAALHGQQRIAEPGPPHAKGPPQPAGMGLSPKFWPIIAAAAGDKAKLAAEMQKLGKGGMLRFYLDWRAAARPLHVPPFQRDGLSDDAVDDIAQYIIQQGKAFYEDILAHPEKHKAIDENAGSAYGTVITDIFYERFHEEIGPIVGRMEAALD
jgi:hypothetical protein